VANALSREQHFRVKGYRKKLITAHLISRLNLIDHYNSHATTASQLTLVRQRNRELEDANDLLTNRADRLETELEIPKHSLLVFQCTTTGATPETSATSNRSTIKLPDPPTFTKGTAEWRAFKVKLKGKLPRDKDRFHNEDHMLEYSLSSVTTVCNDILQQSSLFFSLFFTTLANSRFAGVCS
jgi:hypothetical protein